LVSVIIPTYNGAHTVRETLDSVFRQTYANVEIIVIDDVSTDHTAEVIASYGNRVRFIRREKNSGICDIARLDAMKTARGKYCAMIDQDDLWEPTKLEKQVAFMEAHPDIPLSHTYMMVIDETGRSVEVRHDKKIPPTGPCARELIEHCFITISSIVVKPEVWIDAHQSHGLQFANTDIEAFLHMLKKHPKGFGFIPEVLGSYRRWSQSMSRQNWKWSPEDVNALDRVYQGGYWRGLVPGPEVRRIISRAYWINAEHHRHAGYPDRALYFAWRGLRYRPFWPSMYGVLAKALIRYSLRSNNAA